MSIIVANPSNLDRDREAYRLREWLWRWSARARGQGCGRDVLGGAVYLEFGNGSARYQGLATCGSVWACPVCAPKIGATRAHEVLAAIKWARSQGLHVLFLTSTVRHGRDDSLFELRRQLSDAWRRLRQTRAWREGVGSMVEHSIKATEVTHGEGNGWHPHAHSLMFVRASSGEAARRSVVSAGCLWVSAVARAGGQSLEGPGWDVRLIDDQGDEDQGDELVSKYLAKWGRPPIDSAPELELEGKRDRAATYELALKDHKRSGKGRSWLQLLELAAGGDARAAHLFTEYELAMQGVQALVFSDGLKRAAGLEDQDDDELASESDELELEGVACIPIPVWKDLVHYGLTRGLLEAAAVRGAAGIAGFFHEHLLTSPDELGILLELGSPF